MSVFTRSNDPLPQAKYEDAIKSTSSTFGAITIRGVDALQGKVATNQLPALTSNPEVLIADVTSNMVRKDLYTAGIADWDRVYVPSLIPIFSVQEIAGKQKLP